MSRNLPEIVEVRNEIAEAQKSGDVARAKAAYARELQTLAEQASQAPPEKTPPSKGLEDNLHKSGLVTDTELRSLGDLEGDKDVIALSEIVGSVVQELNKTGRAITVDKLVSQKKVTEFLKGFTDKEVMELTAAVVDLPRALTVARGFLLIAQKHRPDLVIPEDFAFWKVALPVVERIHKKFSQARPASSPASTTPAEAGTRDEYLDTLHAFEERIAEFQARGFYRDANRVYQEQMAWISSQQVEQRIVGSSGRWA